MTVFLPSAALPVGLSMPTPTRPVIFMTQLPLAIIAECSRWNSNPQITEPKSAASANCATRTWWASRLDYRITIVAIFAPTTSIGTKHVGSDLFSADIFILGEVCHTKLSHRSGATRQLAQNRGREPHRIWRHSAFKTVPAPCGFILHKNDRL